MGSTRFVWGMKTQWITCIYNVLRVIANVLLLTHDAAKYGWQYYINSDCMHTDYSCVKSEIKNYGSFETDLEN